MPSAAQDEFDAMYSTQEKKLTTHPEDALSSTSSSDNESTTLRSSNDGFPPPPSTSTMPSAAYHIPSGTTFNANTGPKGVIADAKSFDTAKKRSFRQTLRAYSNGELPPPLYCSSKKTAAFNLSREKSSSGSDASPDADDDEDDFMRTWRANRLQELASMKQDVRTRRSSPSQRKYGTLMTVDPIGYLDAIEKVHADTTVVVLIYDDQVSRRFPPSTCFDH